MKSGGQDLHSLPFSLLPLKPYGREGGPRWRKRGGWDDFILSTVGVGGSGAAYLGGSGSRTV